MASIVTWKVTFWEFPITKHTQPIEVERRVIAANEKELKMYIDSFPKSKYECVGLLTGTSGICEVSELSFEKLGGRAK